MYIKLHRKILDNGVFADAELLKVFVWCILRANSTLKEVYGRKVEVGQFVTGRVTSSEELHLKPSTVYDRMKRLQKQGYIKIDSNTKNSLVTVVKYAQYQYNEPKVKRNLEAVLERFSNEVAQYTQSDCKDFIAYWCEPNRSKTKLRFELQKTFSIPHRLRTWEKNAKTFSKKSSVETVFNNWNEAKNLI